MLSEVVIAAAKAAQRERRPGLTISGVFPCPYHIYKSYTGWGELPPLEGEEILNMENGWFQEEESVKALKRAGIVVENRQLEVRVGKSERVGHIDGTISLNGKVMLWEHKARSMESASRLREKGLKAAPEMKSQVQLYMGGLRGLGLDVEETDIYIKPKDNNIPFDFIERFDLEFFHMVAGWTDRVILEKWIPEPKDCVYCPSCYMQRYCRGDILIDFSGMETLSDDELVKKWRLGKQYSDFGKELVEGARNIMKAKFEESGLEAGDSMLVGPLKVKKYTQHKNVFVQEKFVKKFGAIALLDVMEKQNIPVYRIDDMEEGKVE